MKILRDNKKHNQPSYDYETNMLFLYFFHQQQTNKRQHTKNLGQTCGRTNV